MTTSVLREYRDDVERRQLSEALPDWAPTEVNEAFLREVLAYIRLNPEQWDQSSWGWPQEGCGTSHCLAGWAYVLHTGKEFQHAETDEREKEIISTAMRALGLTYAQAAHLFWFTSVQTSPLFTRHPTFAEFCQQVEKVTGIKFKAGVDYDEDSTDG